MSQRHVESLETRQFFSVAGSDQITSDQITAALQCGPTVSESTAAALVAAVRQPVVRVSEAPAKQDKAIGRISAEGNLTAAQVDQIIAQAASQARPGQAIAVVDREGFVLGIFAMTGATQATIDAAVARARTGAYFQSRENAFTTRTARFIIQDHFPHPIRNTAGGPLYGVEFSSLPGTDMLSTAQIPGISGDPGGLPLFINRVPSGGIGVAGDGKDTAARFDLKASPDQKVYQGREETDFDESVALAGVSGVRAPAGVKLVAAASSKIVATRVFLPGPGLRFPYVASGVARKNPFQTTAQITASGLGTYNVAPVTSQPNPFPKVDASVYGIAGELKNTSTLNADPGFGIIDSDDSATEKLLVSDVNQIITDAVATSKKVRAAIRLQIGVQARVHIAVVDRDGTVLGVFREEDGTNFSFDVAVQKARTAAFFSDDTHAFSTRSIGFMSQLLYPAGLDDGGVTGPLFHLQNALSLNPGNLGRGPLANGITIFPGGIPLYKNGVMVGAIGISGDGVEQDDQISFGGASKYQAPPQIRSDHLNSSEIRSHIVARVTAMSGIYNLVSTNPSLSPINGANFIEQASESLAKKRDVRLPYVKFARNPKP